MSSRYWQSEDDLVGTLVIIGIKEFAVIALQRVAHVHHLLASLLALGILCHAGINLTVQVEFGKECIGCALGSLTVRTSGSRKQVVHAVFQLTLDIVECLLR